MWRIDLDIEPLRTVFLRLCGRRRGPAEAGTCGAVRQTSLHRPPLNVKAQFSLQADHRQDLQADGHQDKRAAIQNPQEEDQP